MSNPGKSLFAAGGIDRSAWTAGISYFVGWITAAMLNPNLKVLSKRPDLLVLGAGLAFFFLAVVVIQRHMDISLQATGFGEPQKLVTTWVFAYSRNPIYVAFLVPLAALGVLSIAAALVAMALYIALMNRFVISREESDLEKLFGKAYLDYKAATPRWLL